MDSGCLKREPQDKVIDFLFGKNGYFVSFSLNQSVESDMSIIRLSTPLMVFMSVNEIC